MHVLLLLIYHVLVTNATDIMEPTRTLASILKHILYIFLGYVGRCIWKCVVN